MTIELLDSITDATDATVGKIVVSGSHGGLYPAAAASLAGTRAVLFNDAGIGLEQAGVAGVLALADVGMAAAGVDCNTCRIGSAKDTLERGVISTVNSVATSLGITTSMSVERAVLLMAKAMSPHARLKPHVESRQAVAIGAYGLTVELLDSASLVNARDTGKIVITGSHGGLIAGDATRAIKAPVRIAVFNDAGLGVDNIGTSRLPALEARTIASVTVSCDTARIGDAASALETGIISALNPSAQKMGAAIDMPLSTWLSILTR
ncbi:MAG: hypothetical protein COB39_05730 [Marinosulfonomonas sp.]|nr:MAG: hypothetical protein COB39_05730 [Marinosulfonomonas sp.]